MKRVRVPCDRPKLDGAFAFAPVQTLSPASRRHAAVRRVEEYLAGNPGAIPSIPRLCDLAGVSERTLEYAFREQTGMTPVRYLKVRRMNEVRRELSAAEGDLASVAEVARRWGFHDLGRFAGEYRSRFGELPSATLRRRRPANPGSRD